ncbi:hypothetical protein D5086_006590, partial [Populus alba]
ENVPIEEVFEKLKCTKEGLSDDDVQKRLGCLDTTNSKRKRSRELFRLQFLFL